MRSATNSKAYRLHDSHFMIAVGSAGILHLLALLTWMIMPHDKVVEIPVRILNIKLGEGGEEVNVDQSIRPSPQIKNTSVVEQEINRFFEKPTPKAAPAPKAMVKEVVKEPAKAAKAAPPAPAPKPVKAEPPAPVVAAPTPQPQAKQETKKSKSQTAIEKAQAQQFVRQQQFDYRQTDTQTQNGGVAAAQGANPQITAAARYEQLISTWIKKFQIYPVEARAQGLQGVPEVRVRIDRHGNVRFVGLEKSTGFQVLDRAAVDMINNANPLPPAPPEYKAGQELLEFKIPVRFNL